MRKKQNTISFKKTPIEIFDKWAIEDKDEGMARGHKKAVLKMFEKIFKHLEKPFSSIEAGCGNGWATRIIKKHKHCIKAIGVDGSKNMIIKANERDPSGNYVCANLESYSPPKTVDIVYSMEVLYYLSDPESLLKNIYAKWIKTTGVFIFGIDHYGENQATLKWPEMYNLYMKTLNTDKWISITKKAGFKKVEHWKMEANKDNQGTLIIMGEKA